MRRSLPASCPNCRQMCRTLDHVWQLRKMSPLRPLTLIVRRGEYLENVRRYLHGPDRLLYAAEQYSCRILPHVLLLGIRRPLNGTRAGSSPCKGMNNIRRLALQIDKFAIDDLDPSSGLRLLQGGSVRSSMYTAASSTVLFGESPGQTAGHSTLRASAGTPLNKARRRASGGRRVKSRSSIIVAALFIRAPPPLSGRRETAIARERSQRAHGRLASVPWRAPPTHPRAEIDGNFGPGGHDGLQLAPWQARESPKCPSSKAPRLAN